MICCEEEREAVDEARAKREEANRQLMEATSMYQSQHEYTQMLREEIPSVGPTAVGFTLTMAQAALNSTQAALEAAQEAYESAWATYEALFAQIPDDASLITPELEAAIAEADFAVGEALAAVATATAEVASATETLAWAVWAVAVAGGSAAASWIESVAMEAYYADKLAEAQENVKEVEEAITAAEAPLHECENNHGVCAKCGVCVDEDDLIECQACGGKFCVSCYSEFIEQIEMMKSVGGGN